LIGSSVGKIKVPNKIVQYKVGKENLYYIYRFIILKWELEWTVILPKINIR